MVASKTLCQICRKNRVQQYTTTINARTGQPTSEWPFKCIKQLYFFVWQFECWHTTHLRFKPPYECALLRSLEYTQRRNDAYSVVPLKTLAYLDDKIVIVVAACSTVAATYAAARSNWQPRALSMIVISWLDTCNLKPVAWLKMPPVAQRKGTGRTVCVLLYCCFAVVGHNCAKQSTQE